MALFREENLTMNKLYQEMFNKKKSQLDEAVKANNSIHADVEAVMTDFASTIKTEIDSEGIKEKLRNLEKFELTTADKSIIKAIDKLVDAITKAYEDFDKFKKGLKYEYILSKKGEPTSTDEVDENAPPSTEEELRGADDQFRTPPEEKDEDL